MKNQPLNYDILGIVRRRKLGFILVAVPVFIGFFITAFLLPPVYRSTTTILIEGQQIPSEYVKTAVTSFVD
ncbi:MAG TPA: chain-length determining protein, partial [candidate division Zixibacteria bacterium]|nr:chain-length determining protein [candidate division Zixibacteria bacterium]